MRLRNEKLTGFRRPTEAERDALASAWASGTRAGALRRNQMFVLLFVLVMTLLRAAGDEAGFNLSAGIGSGVLFLLLSSPFLFYWNGQIRKIRLWQRLLEQGCFRLAPVRGQRVVTNRWNVHYVGFARITLPDESALEHVPMPYGQADSLRRDRDGFDGYAVVMDNDGACLAFTR